MTRVHERHASAGSLAANRHRRADQKSKASYKIILEEVADKQKKLKTVLYPEQKAPRGYTFIPAGDPQLTNRCKKLAREDGLTVFIVSTSRHPRQGLSREIHRVGFHFPSVTVEKACDSLGVTLLNSGRVLQSNFAHLEDGQEHDDRRPTKPKKQKPRVRNAQPALDISLPQAVIDTSARETIRDLFPNIPDHDLHIVVGRSFQKGKGLVGTVADLSLVRRAQLAVIAHIRHTYTEYDSLLKQVPYNEARRRVEKPSLDRLILWRGDDDDAGDMDDVLREVIVIPDDDEEDDEGGKTQGSLRTLPQEAERESSVEYISETDMQIQPIDYSNLNRAIERGYSYSPESDKEIQYLGRNQLRHGRPVQYDQHTLTRMGIHRKRVYEEALDRRRKHPDSLNVHNDHSSMSAFPTSRDGGIHPLLKQSQDRNYPLNIAERGEQQLGRAPAPTCLMPVARPADIRADTYSSVRDTRYVPEKQVVYPSQQDWSIYGRSLEQPERIYYSADDQPPSNGKRPTELRQFPNSVFDHGEDFVGQNVSREDGRLYGHNREPQPRRRSNMILPSIERDLPDEQSDQTSVHGRIWQANPFGSYQPLSREAQRLRAHSIINVDDYEEPSSHKRRRIDDQQSIDSHTQGKTILVPIEQIDDRRPGYERTHEPVYYDDSEHFVADKRIVPLPPKGERARPPVSYQELQPLSPRTRVEMHSDQMNDSGNNHLQSRHRYQVPLSRSKNVQRSEFPSRAIVTPPEYHNDSPSFVNSSQYASRLHESSDISIASRRDVGVIADSERLSAGLNGMMHRLQPIEATERLMPSHFSDMSIDYRQRDNDRRLGRPAQVLDSTTADVYTPARPSTGVFSYPPAIATANVKKKSGKIIRPLTCTLDVVKEIFPEDTVPRTKTHLHDVGNGQTTTPNLDHSPSRSQKFDGAQRQLVWPDKQEVSFYSQANRHFAEPDRANYVQRPAPLPALKATQEPWGADMPSRKWPLNGRAEGRWPHNGMDSGRRENDQPIHREYVNFRPGRRQNVKENDIVVLD